MKTLKDLFEEKFKDDVTSGDWHDWGYVKERVNPFLQEAEQLIRKEVLEEIKGKMPPIIIDTDWVMFTLMNKKDKDWIEGFNDAIKNISTILELSNQLKQK